MKHDIFSEEKKENELLYTNVKIYLDQINFKTMFILLNIPKWQRPKALIDFW